MVAAVIDPPNFFQGLVCKRQADEYPDDEFMTNLGLTRDSTIIEFSNRLLWGTYGRPARHPVRWKQLRDLDTEHLQNILATQRQIPVIYSRAIMGILRERAEFPNE